MARTVVITGAGGGLGGAAARRLADHGWEVIAADLRADLLSDLATRPNVRVVELDVTDSASVDAMAKQVATWFPALDAVVNFAGILALGSVAEVPEEDLRRVLDVNVLGTYRVNRALLDLLIAAKGRIVNLSSETGWQSAAPFNGVYAMSKHAVEAYSDALRRELRLVGVKVVKIQPGPFRTDMVAGIDGALARARASSAHFHDVLGAVASLTASEQAKASEPPVLAAVIEQALDARRPKAAYSVRPDRQRTVLTYLPTALADALVHVGLRAVVLRQRRRGRA